MQFILLALGCVALAVTEYHPVIGGALLLLWTVAEIKFLDGGDSDA